MHRQSGLYLSDMAILKQYGSDRYKITYFKVGLRQKGLEQDFVKVERCSVNDEKLDNNIVRAKSRVFEYAYCNDWDYFVTLTIDKSKYDRTNLKAYQKDLSVFLMNFNRNHNLSIKYLFIPELHEDGQSWHMHGFIYGLPVEHLRLFSTKEKLPIQMIAKLIEGDTLYDWTAYRRKFGFISLERIKSKEGASKYITKYVNKAMETSVKDLNAHMYYCSKGLKVAEEKARGTLSCQNNIPFSFENDYVKVAWLSSDEGQAVLNLIG